MTQSKPLMRSAAFCLAVGLSMDACVAWASDSNDDPPDIQTPAAGPPNLPKTIEPLSIPLPVPIAIHPQSGPVTPPFVNQEPTMPPRAPAPSPEPSAQGTLTGRKAATSPPAARSVLAPAVVPTKPVAPPTPETSTGGVAAVTSSAPASSSARATDSRSVGLVVSAPIARPSTVVLASMEAVGYAAGAMLLGSVTTLAAVSMTARRRRKTPEAASPVVDERLSTEALTPASTQRESEPLAAPLAEPEIDAPLRAPRLSVAELCQVAERWAQAPQAVPELLAPLNLPAQLGSLHGMRAGMVSVTGPARKRNEDACLLLQLDNGATLLMAADGMGGHPDGHLASRLALVGACVGLREGLQRPFAPSPERLLQHAFARAKRLLRQATRAGRLKRDAGTTMILTLVDSDHYVTAYLGDGGAYVRRADGSLVALMQVQKVESNLLDRYLGADVPQAWKPETTRVVRCRKDMLAIGSDGVMDRVDIGEVLQWLASNVATKGQSMTRALRELVDYHCTLVNSRGGPLADDNMTLVAVHMR